MKIVHIINSLGDGGAEHTLFKICKYDNLNDHVVICLKGKQKYFLLLSKLGIKVYCLNMNFFSFNKFFYLIKLLRVLSPDLVQTWLVHSDLIGSIAARFAGIKNIIWNIRYSKLEIGKAKLFTILITKLLSKLSFYIPKLIVVVSRNAKSFYKKEGYSKEKLTYIPNGYDLSILRPNKFKKKKFKIKNKIKKNSILIGKVARYDPKKDHLNLIRALSLIKLKNLNFFCILIGKDVNKKNNNLTSEIKKLKLSNSINLMGQHDNISEVMNGLDINILSSSYGEGFPNVVAESMACGTPCIVTDVGDAAFIVGKTGWIVPPNNSMKLAKAIEKAIVEYGTKKWEKKTEMARIRVEKNFDISRMIKFYNKIWFKVYKKKINF